MATLVLQAAGSALGSSIGGPLLAAVGQAAGGLIGGMIDQRLFGGGGPRRHVEGPRLKQLDGITATEGAPIPRIYGRVRLGGQVIWATRFEEQVETTRSGKSGGKAASPRQPATTTTTYSYFANLAVALCDGPIAFVRRVWADGKLMDLSGIAMRVYRGDSTQQPDPLILARQGQAPAYRGTAYVVFERLPLTQFGNRLPQLSFEVVRPVGELAGIIRGVDLIPGATEFGYHTKLISRVTGVGQSAPENRNQLTHPTDLEASLDALETLMPAARSVALVASWFGTDLRAGHCRIEPAVDIAQKVTSSGLVDPLQPFVAGPDDWSVAGRTRHTARLVSEVNGRAAYGGTPSDASVLAAIAELKARGLNVVFYPFVMMDVPAGNTLADPWTGAASQPAFPWRGRITCTPAPGRPGSPDGTAAAAAEIAGFFGTVSAADFTVSGGSITYSGPDEWSYRRLVLHSAALCKAAGGVDSFIIGSELIGLTRVRASAGVYPAVQQLKLLAAEVRSLLGASVKIGYAADWTEYGAHVLAGGAELRFPLDPLWADANIDFVGIDYYPPVADWRDGTDHLDADEWPEGPSVDYLRHRLGAGEAFDWYYASGAARNAQQRTPITDGAYGKPWVYRAKDLVGWWSNAHVERVGGSETAATGWVPQSKPIWLTEVGCPAVDKGANAPNIFPDTKSVEGGLPPYSSGARDDLIQAQFLEAVMRRFDPTLQGFVPAHNPVSPVYGGRMVDPQRIHVWAWDARPYPSFPHLASVWGDGANWATGHWLNGRIEGMPVADLIRAICRDYALPAPEIAALDSHLDGYVIDRPMSARGALEPVLGLFAVEASAGGGRVRFFGRGEAQAVEIGRDDIVPQRGGVEIQRTRAQETELPRQMVLGFADAEQQYKASSVASRRLETVSRREEASETSAVLRRAEAQRLIDIALQDAWVQRDTAEVQLRPGLIALEPGDTLSLEVEGRRRLYRLTGITDGAERRCRLRALEPGVFGLAAASNALTEWQPPKVPGPPAAVLIDLPADQGEPTGLTYLALSAEPWSGPYTVWRSTDGTSFTPVTEVGRPALLGTTTAPLPSGPLWRWDTRAALTVRLASGAFAAGGDAAALATEAPVAVQGADGTWEILSFAQAELIGPGEWRLTRLIRGLAGSEAAASRSLPTGCPVVVLDAALTPIFAGVAEYGAHAWFRVSAAGRDHADPGSLAFVIDAGRAALLPLAPVHPTARRTTGGIALDWIRRTRRGGDSWDLAEVPLNEDAEAYQVDILDGATVKRQLRTGAQGVIYSSADEIADFGSPRTILTLRIAQIGSATGAGHALTHSVPVAPAV